MVGNAQGPVLIIAGYAPSLINFRGDLLQAMRRAGVEVACAAPEDDLKVRAQLLRWGVRYYAVPVARGSLGLIDNIRFFLRVHLLCLRLRPRLVFAYTIKPVVVGLVAAQLAGVRRRAALITGLGYVFSGTSRARRVLRHVVCVLYRIALSGTEKVFFQNPDDRNLFVQRRIVRAAQANVVNGSGVNLEHYAVVSVPNEPVTFLLIARLLADKGVREYAQAARQLKAEGKSARFLLLGPIDTNPTAISLEEVRAWVRDGIMEYLGRTDDVRPVIGQCSVFVLPSKYGEGTPRTNLEAMAMGRPVITTDSPGCRETVVPGVNGFLVPVGDVKALVKAMEAFISDCSLIGRMGRESRRIAEEKFDVHAVNAQMLREMGFLDRG